MKTSLEKIRQKIAGAPRFAVSAELNDKVLRSMGHAQVEPQAELKEETILLPEGWLSDWLKRSFRQFSYVAIVLTVVLMGSWFLNRDTYSTHLDRARVALENLQSVLDGKPIVTASLIPLALADESASVSAVSDSQVVDLAQTVVHETESAIDLAGKGADPVVMQQALSEVIAFQDQSIPVFAAAVEAVSSDEAVQTVADAIQRTTTDQSVVAKAHEFVLKAKANGEKRVAIDIQTASEQKPALPSDPADGNGRLEKAKAAYLDAKAQIETLKASDSDPDEASKLQAKLEKVVSAFEEGKIGRARGLSIAIAAQSKHFIRKRDEKKIQNQRDGGKAKDPKSLDRLKDKESNDIQIKVERPDAEIEVRPLDLKGFRKGELKDPKIEKAQDSETKNEKVSNFRGEKRDQIQKQSSEIEESHPRIPRVKDGERTENRTEWGVWKND